MAIKQETLKLELSKIENDLGELTAEAVVESARDASSPLHGEFEWNNDVAAHQYRLSVASALIRRVEYVGKDIEQAPVTVPLYVRPVGKPERTYVPISKVARNRADAQALLEAEFTRCEGILRRAQNIADVLGLREGLDRMLDDFIEGRRKVLKGGPPPKSRRRRGSSDNRLQA